MLRDVYYAGVNYNTLLHSVIVLVSMWKLLLLSAAFRELSHPNSRYQSEEERHNAEDVDVGRISY